MKQTATLSDHTSGALPRPNCHKALRVEPWLPVDQWPRRGRPHRQSGYSLRVRRSKVPRLTSKVPLLIHDGDRSP